MGWLLGLPGVRAALKWLGIVGGAVLAVLMIRRSGERTGRAEAQAETRQEAIEAHERMAEAGRDRPNGRDDVAGRLRNGRF